MGVTGGGATLRLSGGRESQFTQSEKVLTRFTQTNDSVPDRSKGQRHAEKSYSDRNRRGLGCNGVWWMRIDAFLAADSQS